MAGAPIKPRTPEQAQHAALLAEERAERKTSGGKGKPKGELRKAIATPENQLRTKGPICGAPRSGTSMAGPGICCQPAGWGTDHKGFGHCKFHMGNVDTHVIAATKQRIAQSMPAYGTPITVGPHEAILQEVHRTAGHVQWLHEMIQWLGRSDDDIEDDEFDEVGIMPEGVKGALTAITLQGIQPSVWLKMYADERQHLVSTCKAAVAMGCAERTVQIAEDQGKMIAMLVVAIFKDNRLGMNAEQIGAFPAIAREHLSRVHNGELLPAPATTPVKVESTHTPEPVY